MGSPSASPLWGRDIWRGVKWPALGPGPPRAVALSGSDPQDPCAQPSTVYEALPGPSSAPACRETGCTVQMRKLRPPPGPITGFWAIVYMVVGRSEPLVYASGKWVLIHQAGRAALRADRKVKTPPEVVHPQDTVTPPSPGVLRASRVAGQLSACRGAPGWGVRSGTAMGRRGRGRRAWGAQREPPRRGTI